MPINDDNLIGWAIFYRLILIVSFILYIKNILSILYYIIINKTNIVNKLAILLFYLYLLNKLE